MIFNAPEWQRYQRHVQLENFGSEAQIKLKQAKVLVVGAGGLGCPVLEYLGAAGVGTITVVDADEISQTNLQRQILFGEAQVGQKKVAVAAQRLKDNNPHITVHTVEQHLTLDNAEPLIEQADLVLDCTDNFAVRYIINDICVNTKTPWIYASTTQYSGQAAFFTPGSACFRCLFPDSPKGIADCNSAGVLSTLPGLVGTLQANEALKFLSGLSTPLKNTLLLIEGLSLEFRKIQLRQNPECQCCNENILIEPNSDDYEFNCETETVSAYTITPETFEKKTTETPLHIIDVRTSSEHDGFNLGGENIPLNDDFPNLFQKKYGESNDTFFIYCQSGIRSKKAVNQLRQLGYNKVYSLSGGITLWLEKQYYK